jgi:predicted phage terminase large subunit-like protein
VFSQVFPNVSLRHDSKAAGRWSTNSSGEYFAIGVDGTVTGKGADLLIIDDPHSEQEAKLAEGDPAVFDKVYEWYTSGPRQRLQPGGSIVMVMCMTGDTDVLMADKTQKKLRDIRPGDEVATFVAGYITTSKINNWQSSGVDSIYTIQTQSGIILRANKEHPFLVEWNGERKWSRLKDLIPGMRLVATLDAYALQDHKPSPDSVQPAKPETATIEKTQMHRLNQSEAMGAGLESSAHVANQYLQKECVLPATESNTRLQSQPQKKTGAGGLKTAMDLHQSSTKGWLQTATTYAMSVVNRLRTKTQGRTGTAGSASTTATKQVSFEAYSATIATLLSDTERFQRLYEGPLSTYSVTLDEIISIFPSGEEEVFDIEVDRTENFIANGVVSHNTRWSKRDLTGQVLKAAAQRSGEEWEVIEFPAILPSGKAMWPEFWDIKELESLRSELPSSKWQAQYMQQPTSDVSAIIKREWWKIWEKDEPPSYEFVIQSWDTAFLKTERADFSACTTWGVFYQPDDKGVLRPNLILLNAFKKRMEFPELKQRAYEEFKEWDVDSLIVEAKAAGSPLIFELRAMGIPVQEFTPTKGNDKIARLNAVSDLFASGHIWVPNTHWAEELIEEVASFPSGDHDDLVDSMSQALLRYRRGGFIQLASDEEDEPLQHRRKEPYY